MPEVKDGCECRVCVEERSKQASSALENLSVVEKPLPVAPPQQKEPQDAPKPSNSASDVAFTTVEIESAQSTNPAVSPVAPEEKIISPDDIIIAVMGLTGSGKTTFIQELTDEKLKIGEGLESCTIGASPHRCHIKGYGTIWLVDTPGFDDSYRTDPQILTEVASFLTNASQNKTLLTGIIYLHRIQDPRTGHAAMKNIRTFKALCGKDGLSRTTLVTTFWENTDEAVGARRENELLSKNELWSFIRECGGKAFRFKQNSQSARGIVEHIIRSKLGPAKLDIQTELDEGKALSATAAGVEVLHTVEELKEFYKEEIKKLTEELAEALKDKAKEAEAIKAKEKEVKSLEQILDKEREKLRIAIEDIKLLDLKKDGLRRRVRAAFCPVM